MERNNEETKHSKINFIKEDSQEVKSLAGLEILLGDFSQIPKSSRIQGVPGQTGLVGISGENGTGRIVWAIKHKNLIPQSFDPKTGIAEFEGKQTLEQIETSMAYPLGAYAQDKAIETIEYIAENGLTAETGKSGFGTIGMEEENFHFTKDGTPASLPLEDQVEIQENALERALEPNSGGIIEQALAIADNRIEQNLKYPENIITSSSFAMLGSPQELEMNSGDFGPYVNAVVTKWYDSIFDPKDPIAAQYWNKIAKTHGFKNFYDMKYSIGNASPVAFAASHVSMGLRSEKINDSYAIGLEEGIAVADLTNSNFGTLLEWMTYSTPIIFGNREGVYINGETRYPKDSRAVARLGVRSTYNGEFLMTPENYKDRIADAMTSGWADRIDRAGYISYHDDLDTHTASAHGRVRLRVTGGSGKDKFDKSLGRVEFTGGAATPDAIALISRNALLQLMGIAAYEAVANGEHPTEFFKYKFPSMTACDEHIELAHSYNFYGSDHPKAAALIEEGRAFLNYMRQNYSHEEIQYLAKLADIGLDKISSKNSVRTLDEFLENPNGNISDVISNMYEDGISSLEISKQLAEFEVKQARKIKEVEGDILKLF